MKTRIIPILFLCATLLASCTKPATTTSKYKLIVKLVVDPNQERLGNLGTPSTIPSGHAAQNPSFNFISGHYLEFAPTAYTPLGSGAVVYHAPETTAGGANAIDFSKSVVKAPGEVFLELPLSSLTAGTYQWVRLSLSYQNYDVQFYYAGLPYTGTLASFVGFNTYLTNYKVKNETVNVNANKLQGYWGFESISGVTTGQAAAGATTVPNPIASTSPIPAGSCVVTGKFASDLVITGYETNDVTVTLSLSINKSFEWNDKNSNGKWDVDNDENVVDMGLRGLVPSYSK